MPTKFVTKLQNLAISYILNSAIYYDFDDDTIICNKNITKTMKYDDKDDCKLAILGCIFKKCSSKSNGAGLQVIAPMSILIHNTIFTSCISKKSFGRGAAIYVVQNSSTVDINLADGMVDKLDVQYCCFDECYGTDNFQFGACLYAAAENTTLFYSSSVMCSPPNYRSNGAQYDLQSLNVVSKSVNITSGYSNYCGGIEYRYAITGYFIHQTLTNLTACFVTAFTDITIENIELSESNFVVNTITFFEDNQSCKYVTPGIIHVRNEPIRIIHFCFINNIFKPSTCYNNLGSSISIIPQLVSRQNNDNTTVTLINCYANIDDPVYWNSSYIITQNCHFEPDMSFNTIEISQLNLGECQGNVTAEPILFSSPFSPSHSFTIAGDFPHSHNKTDQGLSAGAIAGITVGAVAAAAIVAGVVAFFIIKRHHVPDIKEPETLEENAPQMANSNPLYDENGADDPFKEDFANHQNP